MKPAPGNEKGPELFTARGNERLELGTIFPYSRFDFCVKLHIGRGRRGSIHFGCCYAPCHFRILKVQMMSPRIWEPVEGSLSFCFIEGRKGGCRCGIRRSLCRATRPLDCVKGKRLSISDGGLNQVQNSFYCRFLSGKHPFLRKASRWPCTVEGFKATCLAISRTDGARNFRELMKSRICFWRAVRSRVI